MKRLADRWNDFWFAVADPHPICAFRILVGCYLVVYLGVLIPHVPSLFSNEGVYAPYVVLDYAPPPLVAVLVFALTYALTLAFTVGYRTRIVTPLLLTGFLYHYFLQLAVKHSSYDRLIIIYLVVLCFVDAGRVWSLDARAGRTSAEPFTLWAERILRFQSIALYFGAGLWKVFNPFWQSGKILQTSLLGLWSTPIGFWLARQELPDQLWTAAAWTVICFELVLGVFLFIRGTRPAAVVAAALFHLTNTIILYVPEFLVCLAPLVLFIPADTLRAAPGHVRLRSRVLATGR